MFVCKQERQNYTRVYLAGATNELLADLTVVGEKCLVALDAEVAVFLQDVLLAIQGLLALGAVVAFSHLG